MLSFYHIGGFNLIYMDGMSVLYTRNGFYQIEKNRRGAILTFGQRRGGFARRQGIQGRQGGSIASHDMLCGNREARYSC